jgi:hypothetical protein
MGDHVNTKRDTKKHHKRGFTEDVATQRHRRIGFKQYMQELEEELLEQELDSQDDDLIDDK